MLSQPLSTVESTALGKSYCVDDAAGRYIEFCKSTISHGIDLTNIKLILDCAHGATYQVAPKVFKELGADVVVMGVEPDGFNINHNCGSTKPSLLQAAVLEHRANLGIALDGDGDRIIMVDHQGTLVDGDELLFIIAKSQQRKGIGHTEIVGTVMSNLGLEHALAKYNMNLHRTDVGDRYIIDKIRQIGGNVGGESSGHIICLNKTTTGDGTVAALQVLAEMKETSSSLHELHSTFSKYPQQLINLKLNKMVNLMPNDDIIKAVQATEGKLGDEGRVLLRASGTEPIVRVMVEGRDADITNELAKELASAIDTILQTQSLT